MRLPLTSSTLNPLAFGPSLYDSFACVMFFPGYWLFSWLASFYFLAPVMLFFVEKYHKDCTQPREEHGQCRLMRLQILGGGFHLNNCVLVFRMRAGTKKWAPLASTCGFGNGNILLHVLQEFLWSSVATQCGQNLAAPTTENLDNRHFV